MSVTAFNRKRREIAAKALEAKEEKSVKELVAKAKKESAKSKGDK